MAPSFFFLDADDRILDLIRRGDEEALAQLYKTNRRAIASYISRNNGTTDDAEDMLQEAVVVLWERVRSGKFQRAAKLSTFLFAIVKNLWLRELARRRKEEPVPEAIETSITDDPSPLDELIESEQAGQVRDALNKLGDPCKTLLILYYWEELSMDEIAEHMGFANAQTAKSKKYQCKEMLKKLLQQGR